MQRFRAFWYQKAYLLTISFSFLPINEVDCDTKWLAVLFGIKAFFVVTLFPAPMHPERLSLHQVTLLWWWKNTGALGQLHQNSQGQIQPNCSTARFAIHSEIKNRVQMVHSFRLMDGVYTF